MATWLYQLSESNWSSRRFRLEIWEGERWNWPVINWSGGGQVPEPGDIVVFFYAPSGGSDPGIYGWAVLLEWLPKATQQLYFRPTSPTDYLKMNPWWDDTAKALVGKIRGRMTRRTMWIVPQELVLQIRKGVSDWIKTA